MYKPAKVRGSTRCIAWKTICEKHYNTRLPLNHLEDGHMSKITIFEYARRAAMAEQRILELLDHALHDDIASESSNMDLQKPAQTRRGQKPSG